MTPTQMRVYLAAIAAGALCGVMLFIWACAHPRPPANLDQINVNRVAEVLP